MRGSHPRRGQECSYEQQHGPDIRGFRGRIDGDPSRPRSVNDQARFLIVDPLKIVVPTLFSTEVFQPIDRLLRINFQRTFID